MIGYSYIMNKGFGVINAVRFVLNSRAYFVAFLVIALLSFLGYSYLLYGSSLNLALPKIAFGLNIYSLIVSLAISVLLGLSLIMNAFAFVNGASLSGKTGLGAVIAAIIPSSLCCTSVIPAILAAFGASTTTIINVTGDFQGPFVTYETILIAFSMSILFLSVLLVSRNIVRCCMVKR
ncbi:hypothetical protein M1394_00090 [Candidatus Marsarchaeota archaeon]|nr:hypothetical protein [Candidatus Marsarchaeota archaeon]